VHGRASCVRRQRGFNQQRGTAQRHGAAKNDLVRRKQSIKRS
jgi:hypothetical protein